MFETKQDKIASLSIFIGRLFLNLGVGCILITVCLGFGMWGYHYYEEMPWIDSYVNAAMILSGMGPIQELKTDAGKLFAGSYALFSGIFFLFLMAMLFAPVIHRLYHRFHVKEDDEDNE